MPTRIRSGGLRTGTPLRDERTGSRDLSQGTLDALSAHVAVIDERGTVVAVNGAWLRFGRRNGPSDLGVGANYLTTCDLAAPTVPEAAQTAAALRQLLAGERESYECEYPCHAPDEERWFAMRATTHRSEGPIHVVVEHVDISDRIRAERAARLQDGLFDSINAAVVGTDLGLNVTAWSAGAEALYGWTEAEAMGRAVGDLTMPEQVSEQRTAASEEFGHSGRWDGEMELQRKDGSRFIGMTHVSLLTDGRGRHAGYVAVTSDVTERAEAVRDLARARNHLAAVAESMGEALIVVDAEGRAIEMNPASEELLGWQEDELVGRLVHVEVHHHRSDGTTFPARECPMLGALRDNEVVRVEEDLFFRRDGTPMWVSYVASPYETEESQRGLVVVFRDVTEQRAGRMRLEAEVEGLSMIGTVRDALRDDRMELFAQPIVDLSTGATVQHELLIRMRGQDGALVPPMDFLPIAEQYGYICEIDCWVVDQAAELLAEGHSVEINLSAASLGHGEVLAHFERALSEPGVEPERLVIEITETALVENEESASWFLDEIAALGCKVALDDFGTGYGGFTYLKHLPVDYLKVDREFIRDIATNEASLHVTEAVVGLAHGCGQKVVAEGVEDDTTAKLLREMGVDLAQGFGLGRPAPLKEAFRGRGEA